MDGTLQECGPCWLGLFAGHGPHGEGACRALCAEADFRHHRPGVMLAPALSTDREQQQQHILTPALAKAAPAQRHAHHCSTYAHAYVCAHTYRHARARIHTGVHAYTRAHTHSHAHMHMHAHVTRVMGFANFSASLATLPHLSNLALNFQFAICNSQFARGSTVLTYSHHAHVFTSCSHITITTNIQHTLTTEVSQADYLTLVQELFRRSQLMALVDVHGSMAGNDGRCTHRMCTHTHSTLTHTHIHTHTHAHK